jgi:hypothetical protein
MLAVLIALVLLALSVAGVYWLLKSMGQDGVEAAAPGSCKSGRCGVQPRKSGEADSTSVEVLYVHMDEIKRVDEATRNQVH